MRIIRNILAAFAVLFLVNCSKSPSTPPTPTPATTVPVMSGGTTAAGSITATTAISGGNVSANGGATITARGVCWNTTPNPTIANAKTVDGSGTGLFTSNLTGLTPGTVYYVRAYATNSVGTAYAGETSFTTTASGPNVFAVGNLSFGAYNGPVSWLNGIPSAVPGGTPNAEAYSAFINSSDTFISGYQWDGVLFMARLWKNGVGTYLTNSFNTGGNGHAVNVSGSDVYVAGSSNTPTGTIATIWKNSVHSYLPATSPGSVAFDVFVAGTDVYAAGYDGTKAKIWKNGVVTTLNASNIALAESIVVSGTDVYAAGFEVITGRYYAIIWKNGTGTYLSGGATDAAVHSIFVSGADVYAAGYEGNGVKDVAKLWKNGVPIVLSDGTKNTYANSVYVSGTDVYAGGYEYDGTKNIPKLWKNGALVSLQNSSGAGVIKDVIVR